MDHAANPWLRKLGKTVGTALSLAILVVALWLLQRALTQYDLADILARVRETPRSALVLSLAAALASYLALGGFDWLAIHYLRRRISPHLMMLASFISHSISHSAGFAALTGGAIRYRIYTAAGLTPLEVGAVILFCGFTFVLGAGALAAIALIVEPQKFSALTRIDEEVLRGAGIAILLIVSLYPVISSIRRRPLALWRHTIRLPGPGIGGLQVLVAGADLTFAATCLYVLLPEGAPPLWAFVGIYVLANLSGVVAHVPGGIGVFETAIVLMLPDVPADATLGALLLFRVTYNLVPLVIGVLLMTGYEVASYRRRAGRGALVTRIWLRELEPAGLALMVFGAGAMLLFTGALPDVLEGESAERWLQGPVSQGAYLVAAGMGAGLLLIARGVFRRLASASNISQLMLAIGASAAWLRGLHWEAAAVCVFTAVLLRLGQRNFYRTITIAALGQVPGWIGAGGSILLATAWLTVMTLRQSVPIDLDMLAAVGLDLSARAVRALVAAVVTYAVLVIVMNRRSADHVPQRPAPEDLQQASTIAAASATARGERALQGDLDLLIARDGSSFLMYRPVDGIWLSLGEPVGPEGRWPDLAWAFREACEAVGTKPAFFAVAQRPLYLDLGLGFAPIGEEGRVDLSGLDPQSPGLARIRDSEAAARAGITLQVDEHPAGRRVVGMIDNAEVISAALWCGRKGGEVALGDWRVKPNAPAGAMVHLTLDAIEWAVRHKYRRFQLGLVPRGRTAEETRLLQQFALTMRLAWSPVRLAIGQFVRWRPVYAALPPGCSLVSVMSMLNEQPAE